MQRSLRWSALIPGLVVAVAISAAAGVVLVFGRIGSVHGRTTRLYLTTSQARGVIVGTEVWLDGERIGRVAWLQFRPPATDTAQRLLVALDVIESVRPYLRRDTRALIRPGTSLIGAPVVYLSGGSPAGVEIATGDTLATVPESERDGSMARIADASQDLPVILDNFQSVRTQLFSNTGTIGALSSDEGGRHFEVLTDRAAHLSARARNRVTALGGLGHGDLVARAHQLLAATDSLRQAAAAARSAPRRMASDSALRGSVRDLRAEAHAVRMQLAAPASGDSTAIVSGPGAAMRDLRQRLAAAEVQLGRLEADVARRPLRYIVF